MFFYYATIGYIPNSLSNHCWWIGRMRSTVQHFRAREFHIFRLPLCFCTIQYTFVPGRCLLSVTPRTHSPPPPPLSLRNSSSLFTSTPLDRPTPQTLVIGRTTTGFHFSVVSRKLRLNFRGKETPTT
jgi:hypothetical protein